MDILAEALKIQGELVCHRRYLHKNAEVGFDLYKTAEYITEVLTKEGCKLVRIGKGGIYCVIGKGGGECVLIRGDVDGLPILEKTNLPFKSEKGNMHACGHDMHASMLLGCAKILKNHEDELRCPVKLVFQGGEEQLLGACDLIENGILENPRVISAGMLHVMTGSNFDTGTVILPKSGEVSPYADVFEITVYGKGTHGAMACLGIDTGSVLCHISLAIESIIAKELGLNQRGAITVGAIECGKTHNVLSDTGCLKGSLRSYSGELQKKLKRRITEVSTGISGAFNARAEVKFLGNAPPLFNNASLVESSKNVFCELLGEKRVIFGGEEKSTGSEDFAHISQRVPSLMVALCAGRADEGFFHPLHNPETDFDEKALPYGTALYTAMAQKILPTLNNSDRENK